MGAAERPAPRGDERGHPGRVAAGSFAVGVADAENLWSRVDSLVARAPSVADLVIHRLQRFETRRCRAARRNVPRELELDERQGMLLLVLAREGLRRAREAYDDRIRS